VYNAVPVLLRNAAILMSAGTRYVRGGEILSEIIDETIMDVIGNETSFELNLGALKVKHTVKREKRIT